MEIYKNEYVKFIYDENNSLIIYYWSDKTEDMTDENYKSIILLGVDYVKKFKPKYLLADQKIQKFIVAPSLQVWNAKETLPQLFKAGIIKFAIIESEDIIVQIATEQTIEEDENKKYGLMFFENEEDAKRWFKK